MDLQQSTGAGWADRAAGVGPVTIEGEGLGPDGSVYLHRDLPLADAMWFSAGCRCGALRPIGVRPAIAAASPGSTVLGLARWLRCRACINNSAAPKVRPGRYGCHGA